MRSEIRQKEESDREGYSRYPHAKDESLLWEAEAAWPGAALKGRGFSRAEASSIKTGL
jgi:hypothetical protein